eukprot:TRINITY_DN915_c0_g1_i1.p1 TRINITY_DN915_c0_g1~~TRINITY_DN915_c0_g1_i1.p1  ORF type:complete len:384 (-),score=70.74 TRINITY_DN915_c0_g1_i1:109-1260(-)
MKSTCLALLLIVAVALAEFSQFEVEIVPVSIGSELDNRLIEFNETHRRWMTMDQVLELATECGKKDQAHGGFFDITDHLNLTRPLTVKIPEPPTKLSQQVKVKSLLGAINMQNWIDVVTTLSAIENRYYAYDSGKQGAQTIYNIVSGIISASGRPAAGITVSYFDHTWTQPSVIARIPGTTCSSQIVILSAHQDSIVSGMTPGKRSPGADDDASGSSAITEIFRVLVSDPTFVPERSIEFHWYAAEEVGLRGSQAVADSYKAASAVVVGDMQLDMVGYRDGLPAFVTDYVSSSLTTFATNLAAEYTETAWTTTVCGYGCSDHASWTKAAYPSIFPFETLFPRSNSKIHTANDLLSNLDSTLALNFVQLGVAFAVELGSPGSCN